MRISDFSRCAFGFCVAAALLAGCGGSQPSIRAPSTLAQNASVVTHGAHGQAAKRDLIYAATGNNVYILTYPAGKFVGALNVNGYTLCSDRDGDVFVPEPATDQILEYAHGVTTPFKVLSDEAQPLDCAVDKKTGDRAVTNEASGQGTIAVFPKAEEPAQYFGDPAMDIFGQCGYDSHGNLFADGIGNGNIFAELPEGSGTFRNFTMPDGLDAFGSVQWDGTYITLANPTTRKVYRLQVSGSRFKIAGIVRASGWQNAYEAHWPYIQTWLRNGAFVAQSKGETAEIGIWPYPVGGRAKRVIGNFESSSADLYGVTISLAQR